MGGSGGYSSDFSREEFEKLIQQEVSSTQFQEFELEVNDLIRSLLYEANNRDTEQIRIHLDTIQHALESDIEGVLNLKFGGSVSKHTYVDGLSDVDVLVMINNSELIDKTPAEVKNYFFNRLSQRLPNTEINEGALAITVKFKTGKEIQLLPAIRHGDGLKIATWEGEWSNKINPERFAKALTRVNQNCSNRVVPLVKLSKAIISSLPDQRKMSGYHVEALAVKIFSNYNGSNSSKDMLKYFFDKASTRVLSPIREISGQSTHVDEYLGAENSAKRKMISDSLSQISRRMRNADISNNIETWRDILSPF